MDMIDLNSDFVSTIEISTDKLSCILCKNEKFKTNGRLFKHLLNAHKDSSTVCRFCQRTFFSKQDYIDHASKHSNTKSHVYKCSICPQSFFSKAFLLEHQKKHSSISNYIDGFMHKVDKVDDHDAKSKVLNKYKKSLDKVVEQDEEKMLVIPDRVEDEDPFSSVGDYFNRSVRKAEKIDNNTSKPKRKYVKVKRGPAKVKKSDRIKSSKVVRDKLMECLEGIVDHTRVTKRYFEDGTEMDILDEIPEESPWAPHLIDKKEVTTISVAKTLQEISKMDQSLDMLACEECDQLFSSESFLNRHMAAHAKRNLKYKYVCKYCAVRYCAPKRLFAHFSKFHKNETPFSCEICSVTFVKKVEFSNHIQSKHDADGIIKFLENGLIAYVCKSKILAEASSQIDVDSSKNCDLDKTESDNIVAKDNSKIDEGKSNVSSQELNQGKVEELKHWKGGLLKHWEGGGDNLNTEKGDKLSSGKGDDLHPEKGDNLSSVKGDDLHPEKGDNLSSAKGDNLLPEKGDNLSSAKGDKLHPEKGDNLSSAKGDNLHPEKGDNLSSAKGDNLHPEKGDNLSSVKGNDLNREKGANLSSRSDDMHSENDDSCNLGYDEIHLESDDDKNTGKADDLSPDKGEKKSPNDKLNPKNDDIASPEKVDIKTTKNVDKLSLEKNNDMSIELVGALGLRKVNTSESSEKSSPEKRAHNWKSPIRAKSTRISSTKRPKFSVEISDTEESSWDDDDDEPLSVIRKSKNFKTTKKHKNRHFERCDICDIKLKAGSMKRHKQRHSGNQRFHCHLCKLSIKEEYKFHLHMKAHFQFDKFLCICGVRLPNKQSLDEHKRIVHSKDNQTQNLTMIRSVGNPLTHGKQSKLQSSQVLVKKMNEKPRVFNVQTSQGKVTDVVKNFIRKVDPTVFARSVNTSVFKERAGLNFSQVVSPIGEKKKMNFTIKMISSQEAEKRNKIVIKPVPAAAVNVIKPTFNIQPLSAPKFQDSFSKTIKKTDGFDAILASPDVGNVAKQVGKRKYVKVNMNELIKNAAKSSPIVSQSVNGLHLVTANPLAHLIGNSPVSEPCKAPSRKGKSFDYQSIIQKSLLDQLQMKK